MASVSKLANYLSENAESLAVEIVDGVLNQIGLDIPQWEKDQAIMMYIEFVGFLGTLIREDKEGVPEDLISWSKKNAEHMAASGGKISEIVVRYPPTRHVFIDLITKFSLEFDLSVKENAEIIKKINVMLDTSLNETVFAFEKLSKGYKEKSQKELAELSAPIVLIKEGIAILPLIGALDSYRVDYILEKVVPRISQMGIQYLIVDYSGMPKIDGEIAAYLRQIGDILLLLGIRIVITGLRPELVQTVVKSGIDMTAIRTFAHVKQALEFLEK